AHRAPADAQRQKDDADTRGSSQDRPEGCPQVRPPGVEVDAWHAPAFVLAGTAEIIESRLIQFLGLESQLHDAVSRLSAASSEYHSVRHEPACVARDGAVVLADPQAAGQSVDDPGTTDRIAAIERPRRREPLVDERTLSVWPV